MIPAAHRWLWFGLMVLLSACSSRYQHSQDFTPPSHPDPDSLQEPSPVSEPVSVMGNGPEYRVRGQRYQVLRQPGEFTQRGIASWYGMKFHGHATSNGEIYDVYQFTAAHKTLPLPSYVRVTREDNGKSVVVRVNDRGPFHDGRVIDLSYIAAARIGLDKDGTAPVKVELLAAPENRRLRWVQVSALSDLQRARAQQQQLRQQLAAQGWPVLVYSGEHGGNMVHRVRIGPVQEGDELELVLARLEQLAIERPIVLASHQLDTSRPLK